MHPETRAHQVTQVRLERVQRQWPARWIQTQQTLPAQWVVWVESVVMEEMVWTALIRVEMRMVAMGEAAPAVVMQMQLQIPQSASATHLRKQRHSQVTARSVVKVVLLQERVRPDQMGWSEMAGMRRPMLLRVPDSMPRFALPPSHARGTAHAITTMVSVARAATQ